jgi:hypothetical protein
MMNGGCLSAVTGICPVADIVGRPEVAIAATYCDDWMVTRRAISA